MGGVVTFKKSAFNDSYYPYLNCDTRMQIFFGGSSSGKSFFLAQRRVRALLKGGRNYLCVRNVGATLKTSIFNETSKAINLMGLSTLFKINKSDLTITCQNGYQAIFKGLDDIEKVKSITPELGVLTDIDIEEATECSRDALRQLRKRLRGKTLDGIKKRVTMAFNPILKSHWIYQEYFAGKWVEDKSIYHDDHLLIIHSTYKSNRYLEPDDIHDLENEPDPYMYQVYTLGKWGVLGGLIFNNFEIRDILNDDIFKTFDQFKNGLDFGFTNDPTAFTRSYYHKATKTIYVFKEWGAHNVTNGDIFSAISPIVGNEMVVCDSAEPKSIQELTNLGLYAVGAKKGPDSIRHGINWLKQQKIVIDPTCQMIINNFEQYHWKKDKWGEPTNIPVDKFNDFIDQLRYAYEDEMAQNEIFMVWE